MIDPSDALASCSNQFHEPAAKAVRRHKQFPVPALAAVPGEKVEEVREVGTDVGIMGEETDVFVDPRRGLVVVASPDVGVTGDGFTALVADDERNLGVGLEAGHSVDDMHTGVFQPLRPFDVAFLVEASLQLDKCHHLFALVGGVDQSAHNRAVSAGPVQRLFDGQDLRVPSRLVKKCLGTHRERVIGMMNEKVTIADHAEDVGGEPVDVSEPR